MMTIVCGFPPNFDAIAAAFPMDKFTRAIFCYGSTIYNPSGGAISEALVEHEAVHEAQQGSSINEWWRAYIVDPAFRLAQEIPAHQREYEVFCETARDRVARRLYLSNISRRLASPLYGNLITLDRARTLIKGFSKRDPS